MNEGDISKREAYTNLLSSTELDHNKELDLLNLCDTYFLKKNKGNSKLTKSDDIKKIKEEENNCSHEHRSWSGRNVQQKPVNPQNVKFEQLEANSGDNKNSKKRSNTRQTGGSIPRDPLHSPLRRKKYLNKRSSERIVTVIPDSASIASSKHDEGATDSNVVSDCSEAGTATPRSQQQHCLNNNNNNNANNNCVLLPPKHRAPCPSVTGPGAFVRPPSTKPSRATNNSTVQQLPPKEKCSQHSNEEWPNRRFENIQEVSSVLPNCLKKCLKGITPFPFETTASGNLKVAPDQVVFQTDRISVLVAEPRATKVNIKGDFVDQTPESVTSEEEPPRKVIHPPHKQIKPTTMAYPNDDYKRSQKQIQYVQRMLMEGDIPRMPGMMPPRFAMRPPSANMAPPPPLLKPLPSKIVGDDGCGSCDGTEYSCGGELMNPELPLDRLGVTASHPIAWSNVVIHDKTNLFDELHNRITNYKNPDIIVEIGNEEFSCHLLVLQCYSVYFDNLPMDQINKNIKINLPEKHVTPSAFPIIYDWMISTNDSSYRLLKRTNVLDIFLASKYLKISELEEQCWMFIDSTEVFSEDSAFMLYLEAKSKKLYDVMELMLPRIQNFFLTLVGSQDYLDLSAEEIRALLSSNYIVVNCEMEVLMSAVRWLKHDWEERKAQIIPLMNCIQFGMIEPWQLVDIKRNPENPEFLEIMKIPEVLRIVDDGLAFVIIKYWYGIETEDFRHWVGQLGLKEPQQRNWTGRTKTYVTYREFLRFLEEHRQEQILKGSGIPKNASIRAGLHNNGDNSPAHRIGDGHGSTAGGNEVFNDNKSKVVPTMKELMSLIPTVASENTSTRPNSAPSSRNDEIENEYMIKKSSSNILYHQNTSPLLQSNRQIKKNSDFSELILNCKKKLSMSQPPKYVLQEQSNKQMKMISPKLLASTSAQKDAGFNQRPTFQPEPKHKEVFSKENPIDSRAPVETFYNRKGSRDKPQPSSGKRKSLTSVITAARKSYFLEEGSLFDADRETVLVFGGTDPHSQYGVGRNTGKDVYRYVTDRNVWEFVTELPEPRHHHSVALLRARIYLAGGADPRNDEKSGKSVAVSTIWSFDPVQKTWYQENELAVGRKNFGLVVHRQKMFAIGGQDSRGRVLSSVERFDPTTGMWYDVAPLRSPKMGVACAKYKDYIWVVGGMTNSRKNPISRDVECYDIRNDQWTQIVDLRFPRCFGSLIVFDDKLYLFGGAAKINSTDPTTSIASVDMWNNEEKTWCPLSEMSVPRHGHTMAYSGTRIMTIGGVTTVYMRALNSVECYCCEQTDWVKGVAPLPTPLSGHGTVTLPPASLI